MERFAIWVTLKIAPDSTDNFLLLIKENQKNALAKEPGCHQFIVLKDQLEADILHFYEEYENEEAFKDHQASEHFRKYAAEAKDMIIERSLQQCLVVE